MNLPAWAMDALVMVGGIAALVLIFLAGRNFIFPIDNRRPVLFAESAEGGPFKTRETYPDDTAYDMLWFSYGIEKDSMLRSLRQLANALRVPLGYLRPGDNIADYGYHGRVLLERLGRDNFRVEKIDEVVRVLARVGPILAEISSAH